MGHYIIVGFGLAGLALTETLLKEGHSVSVFDDQSQQASRVAGGLYNPVVLKRFNMAWEGSRLMKTALPFYRELEEKLGIDFDEEMPVLRLLASAGEQNDWFEAAERPGLSEFLSPGIIANDNPALKAPFGFGAVLHSGRIHTAKLLKGYRDFLSGTGSLTEAPFEHKELQVLDKGIEYRGIRAEAVIFCEGFGLRENPFFNYLPLNGTKGELLVIHAPMYKESRVVKSGVFTIPLGGDRYLVGATYNHKDKSPDPTKEARGILLEKLHKFMQCDFSVEGQRAGIRPTVPDRRPLVGAHPVHQHLFVLNGLGSRGVLIAPYAARALYRLIRNEDPLPPEMDCARFSKRYEKLGRKS
jgi:glycine oxidase